MASQTELEEEVKVSPAAVVVNLDNDGGSGGEEGGALRRNTPREVQMRIMKTMPKAIRNQHMCMKFVYLCVYGLLLWLLYSLPSEMLWNSNGTVASEYSSLLLFSATVSYVCFLLVQGSNPGYIEIGGDGEAVDRSLEMRSLLRSSGGDDANDAANGDNDQERKPIAVSHGLIPDGQVPGAGRGSVHADRERAAGVGSGVADADVPARSNIAVPLRSKYCKTCKARVCTFDHHCFIIGTCIGERNHCRFWWLLLTTSITICISIVVVDNGYKYERYWWDWIVANQLGFLASIIFYFLLLMIGGLFIFHTWLACTASTTYELAKHDELAYLHGFKQFDLPFSNGLLGNLEAFCCVRDGIWGVCGRIWRPKRWKPPARFDRNSEDIFENCWENAYWSCC